MRIAEENWRRGSSARAIAAIAEESALSEPIYEATEQSSAHLTFNLVAAQ